MRLQHLFDLAPSLGLDDPESADVFQKRVEATLAEQRAVLKKGAVVKRPILSRLVKGLNRLFTGMLVNSDRELYLATSGNYSQAKVSRILVFGDKDAERVLAKDEFDKKAFQANSRRLEQRLGSLGLLRRLSDGCAYVVNPYRVEAQ